MQSHKLGEAMFDEDDIFCPPSFDEKIYYDESMPPIYDDYIDESGFGEVMTLFSDESTISGEVPIDYGNKVAIYDDYCDDMYAIKKKFAYVESRKFSMLVDHEKNALGSGYIVEFIHDDTENYYEGGIYA